jgi:hypothetical protein
MPFAPAVVERTMKVQEVLMQAISGQLTWLEAEDILGWRPRTLRRWRLRYQQRGYDGLWDRRRQQPSPRCAPVAEVARITRLYRELWYRGSLGRPTSESGRLRHGDGAHGRGDRAARGPYCRLRSRGSCVKLRKRAVAWNKSSPRPQQASVIDWP